MQAIYKLGVVIGIVAIYTFFTIGLGYFLVGNEYGDHVKPLFMAWLLGMCSFVILAIITLEKFGLWMG